MIRVIIVDDELLARVGLQSFLEKDKDIRVEATFERATDALAYLEQTSMIDVVITDVEMNELQGLNFIAQIRQEKINVGIVIASCHADFEYAREAVRLGADAYVLKQEISETSLVEEIRKVYHKHMLEKKPRQLDRCLLRVKQLDQLGRRSSYVVAVVRFTQSQHQPNQVLDIQTGTAMRINIIETIIEQYPQVTLFNPCTKPVFLLFDFEKEMSWLEQKKRIRQISQELYDGLGSYVNQPLALGVSQSFSQLKELADQYQQAQKALDLSFYDRTEYLFFADFLKTAELPSLDIEHEKFLTESGISQIIGPIHNYLAQCKAENFEVGMVKQMLFNKVHTLIERILEGYPFSDKLSWQWDFEFGYLNLFENSEHMEILEKKIEQALTRLQIDIMREMKSNRFSEICQFIESNIETKIKLEEMAEYNNMSVASFSKKFKNSTGMTLVQYVNSRRIEKAKRLLKKEEMPLIEVAEQVGFSNENYLTRVFKKVTGETIKDYRNNVTG